MLNCQVLIEKLPQIKQSNCLLGNELSKLKTFDSIYFRGKRHFEDDSTQNYLVFQSVQTYFKRIAGVGNDNYINIGNIKDCLMKKLILLKYLIM